MYICLCHNVTDSDIRKIVRNEGVKTMKELRNQLGVASQCGKCARYAKEVLQEALLENENNLVNAYATI